MSKKIVWDLARAAMHDTEAVDKFLNDGFEPFSVTNKMQQSKDILQPNKMEVIEIVWMRRPIVTEVSEPATTSNMPNP